MLEDTTHYRSITDETAYLVAMVHQNQKLSLSKLQQNKAGRQFRFLVIGPDLFLRPNAMFVEMHVIVLPSVIEIFA